MRRSAAGLTTIRSAAALLALGIGLSLGLGACGGGGSSGTAATGAVASGRREGRSQAVEGSRRPAHSQPPRQSAGGAPGGPDTGGEKPGRGAAPAGAEAIPPKLEHKAGKAAPFLAPGGDNSIPTYGSQASGSQQGEAEAALVAYLKARGAGSWAAACTGMGAAVQKQLAVLGSASGAKAQGCAATYAALSSQAPAAERADPFSGKPIALRVKGENAFALFQGPANQQYMMPMVNEGGRWKVNQIAPIPYPPGVVAPNG